jgi:HlyD family secretion protein
MDTYRPQSLGRTRARWTAYGVGGVLVLVLVSLGLSRLQAAAPAVERSTLWIDTVKRGPLVRQVRGVGSLVPEEVRWVAALTEGRVERLRVQPGAKVAPDTVLLELTNPDVELQMLDAESRLRAAEAQYADLKVRLESQRLDRAASAARVQAEYRQARMRADTDEELALQGLVARLTSRLSKVAADELGNRNDAEEKRLAIESASIESQLAVQQAQIEQARALARLRRIQRKALVVRAGIDGVVQQIPVDVGQRVAPGTNLARVARPDRLKAVIRIPETQARDLQVGQAALIDTRSGQVAGRVTRLDPAVQGGTVAVDVIPDGPLPSGARPDLSIDATIDLERLENVLYVGRPSQVQPNSLASLFRLSPGNREARRVQVRLGRVSANAVEVTGGLEAGDQVVLSDTSAWDAFERIVVK